MRRFATGTIVADPWRHWHVEQLTNRHLEARKHVLQDNSIITLEQLERPICPKYQDRLRVWVDQQGQLHPERDATQALLEQFGDALPGRNDLHGNIWRFEEVTGWPALHWSDLLTPVVRHVWRRRSSWRNKVRLGERYAQSLRIGDLIE